MFSWNLRALLALICLPLMLSPAVCRAADGEKAAPKPNLIVGSTVVAPTVDGKISAGTRLIFGISVKNIGDAATDDKATFTIDCTVIKGGECPIKNLQRALPVIEPGQWKSVNLVQQAAAEPGTYQVTVSVQPTTRLTPTRAKIVVLPRDQK